MSKAASDSVEPKDWMWLDSGKGEMKILKADAIDILIESAIMLAFNLGDYASIVKMLLVKSDFAGRDEPRLGKMVFEAVVKRREDNINDRIGYRNVILQLVKYADIDELTLVVETLEAPLMMMNRDLTLAKSIHENSAKMESGDTKFAIDCRYNGATQVVNNHEKYMTILRALLTQKKLSLANAIRDNEPNANI